MIKKFGSDAAYALVANSNPAILVTEAAMVGVALTITAATFAFKAWENYKEKERLDKIREVLSIHNDTLTKISIEAHNLTVDFPAPFQLVDGTYHSLNYTPEELNAMCEDTKRTVGELNLRCYRRYVSDALNMLVGISKSLKDEAKLTTPVIHYIIHMVESKFTKFEGYDWDIAMLNALLKFISRYMSMFDKKDAQNELFTKLAPVYAQLDLALEELCNNKKNRKQTTILAEASSTFEVYTELYIKAYLQLITPFTEWEKIQHASLKTLKSGEYSSAFAKKELGFFHHTIDASKIDDSLFKDWFQQLIEFYWAAVDNIITKDEHIPSINEFNLPANLPKKELEKIVKIFSKTDNFLTTVRDPEPPHIDFIPITNSDYILKYRVPVLTDLAKQIQLLCSFQLVLGQIDKILQNLGEIEASDPKKCKDIYRLHTDLCKAMKRQLTVLKDRFNQIKLKNEHYPQLATKQAYFVKLEESFDSLQLEIQRHYELIRHRRKMLNISAQETKNEMQHQTHELITLLNKACNLNPPLPKQSSSHSNSPTIILPEQTFPQRKASKDISPLAETTRWERFFNCCMPCLLLPPKAQSMKI